MDQPVQSQTCSPARLEATALSLSFEPVLANKDKKKAYQQQESVFETSKNAPATSGSNKKLKVHDAKPMDILDSYSDDEDVEV
jgi:hypothetical protein